MVLYGTTAYIFGGFDGRNRFNDMRALGLAGESKRWLHVVANRSTQNPPKNRFGHTAVVYENSMYVFGGWDGHETLSDLYEYLFGTNEWINLPPRGSAPKPRYRHSAVIGGTKMFVFGGVDKTQTRYVDFHVFDCVARTWTQLETGGNVPSARTFHRAVMHRGYMYILGGFDGRRQNDTYRIKVLSAEQERIQEQRNNVARNGALTNGAASAAAAGAATRGTESMNAVMPEDFWQWIHITGERGDKYTPRTGHAVVVWNDHFYLFGGTDETARQNDIYQYDIPGNRWDKVIPSGGVVPASRSGSKGVVYRDYVYFFGGYTKKDGEYFNDVFRYSIPNKVWETVRTSGDDPPARTDHSCVVQNNRMLVFGGFDGRVRFQDLQMLDLEQHRWEQPPEAGAMATPPPMGRFGHTAVIYNNSMFIFGGWNGHETLDDLYEFSLGTFQWYNVPNRGRNVPKSRYRHSAAVYGCSMFIFGGVDKNQDRFADLFEFNIDTREWAQINTMGHPPTARTFHRAVVWGGYMYVLGGFDGSRKNDMYKIALVESIPRDEARQARRARLGMEGLGAAPDTENDAEAADKDYDHLDETGQLKRRVNELLSRLAAEIERNVCKVCYERDINCVLLDCAHRVVCSQCAESLPPPRMCPVCRKPIRRALETFNA